MRMRILASKTLLSSPTPFKMSAIARGMLPNTGTHLWLKHTTALNHGHGSAVIAIEMPQNPIVHLTSFDAALIIHEQSISMRANEIHI